MTARDFAARFQKHPRHHHDLLFGACAENIGSSKEWPSDEGMWYTRETGSSNASDCNADETRRDEIREKSEQLTSRTDQRLATQTRVVAGTTTASPWPTRAHLVEGTTSRHLSV